MKDLSLLDLYKIAYKYLSNRRKRQLFYILFIMTLNSFSELISIAILIPFFSTLLNIEETYSKLPIFLRNTFLANSQENFLITFVISITFISLISGVIRMCSLYSSYKVSALIANELIAKTYRNILNKEYSFFLKEETSKLISILTNDGIRFLTQLIMPTLNFINYISFLLFMSSILLFVSWKISLSIFIVVLLMYGSVSVYAKRLWKTESKNQANLLQEIVQKLSINFGSIEYIKLYNLNKKNTNEFKNINYQFNNSISKGDFVASAPRIFLEYLMIIIFITLSVYLGYINQLSRYLPLLITSIILAQKILPLMQKVYESLALVSTTKDSFANIVNYLKGYQEGNDLKYSKDEIKKVFNQFDNLTFENVYFGFNKEVIFKNICFKINRGEKVAIIGESGTGKTTLLRMILGLLSPFKGEIIVNENNINVKNQLFKRSWQNMIGYVSQDIYLLKGTIRSNINFFGKDKDKGDEFINKVVKMASFEKCVKKNGGLDSLVSEAGIGFSGGEKQRLGIARALYKSDQILVMDEPTSSLDLKMRNKILRNILKINDLTFICVLHDFENLSEFDKVIRCSDKKLEVISNMV